MKRIAFSVAALAALTCSTASAIVITVYTDRATWEAAVLGEVTEDFDAIAPFTLADNATTTVGLLDVQTIAPAGAGGETAVRAGADTSFGINVNGTNFLGSRLDGTPTREMNIIFSAPVFAWGADYQFGDFNDSALISFLTVSDIVGGGGQSGFIGYTSDTAFSQVNFQDAFVSATFIGLDNVSFGGEVIPEPATMTLLGLGLAGFALRRRKMKA